MAIHQPQYLPWLGYLDKLDRSDVFVLLDTVQFKKNEWQNRNRIRTAQGWQYLTVPVLHEFPQRLDQVRINNQTDWRRKHVQALETHYGKAPHYGRYASLFLELLARDWERLSLLNEAVLSALAGAFGITTPIVKASQFEAREEQTGRLVDLCKAVGADCYLAGAGGRGYMNLEGFQAEGIAVEVQDFMSPEYAQVYRPFIAGLSAVDLLFNCGGEGFRYVRDARTR
ncbi:MAG: WbqC family protein [Nitrospirales bacterium]|nr:WbqC family protein [Nitrospirales bacterium]